MSGDSVDALSHPRTLHAKMRFPRAEDDFGCLVKELNTFCKAPKGFDHSNSYRLLCEAQMRRRRHPTARVHQCARITASLARFSAFSSRNSVIVVQGRKVHIAPQ